MSHVERCLIHITETSCARCGGRSTSFQLIFHTSATGYSYQASPGWCAALERGEVNPVGYFHSEQRQPCCPSCIGRLPRGWPEFPNQHPSNVPHSFRWQEPQKPGNGVHKARHHSSQISEAAKQKARNLLDEL
jgi:hypothetical protein